LLLQVTILTSTEQKPDFKFIHTADTHLGLNWPPIGRQDRIQIPVYGRVFASIIDAALKEGVDFVVHGGDLVDRPRPSTAAWNRLLEQLPRLKDAGIPFIVTPGSHDRPESYFDKAGGDVLEILDKRAGLVKRLDADREPFLNFKVKSGKTVTVYGLGDHDSDQQQLLESLKTKMTTQSDFGILLIHGSISNMPTMAGPTVKADTVGDMLGEGLLNYVGMGHNHKRWEHKDLQIYNPGSPEYTSFADAPTIFYEFNSGTLEEKSRDNLERGYYLVEVSGEITNAKFQVIQARDVRNVQVQFNGATSSQVSDALKSAKNASESTILRPLLTGSLHPSTSRSDVDVKEVMSLRAKFLYLDYPLMRFADTETEQTSEETDIQHLLMQHFATRLEKPEDGTKIATGILASYTKKTKTSHQEALSIIDEWKPND
jgi:DNA repair exonuclease SbcCD nuclease subunit